MLNRVCIIKRVIGKFDEADSAIRQAVDGVKECFFNEGLYAWTLENLALLREAEKRNDDAAKIYAEAVSAYERICGFPSYEAAEALYHQSGCPFTDEKSGSSGDGYSTSHQRNGQNRTTLGLREIGLSCDIGFDSGRNGTH